MRPGHSDALLLDARNDALPSPDLLEAGKAAAAPDKPTGCVLGFGDILSGDRAFGCCVVDALLQCGPGPRVTIAYCGGDFRGIEAWMYRTREVHVALGASLGGRPGTVRSLDWAAFLLASREQGGLEAFRDALGAALARLRLIDAQPGRVVIHVGQTLGESGFGMSRPALRAARAAALRIQGSLITAGLALAGAASRDRLFCSTLLKKAF